MPTDQDQAAPTWAPGLLTTPEACHYLRVSVSSLRRIAANDPAFPVPRQVGKGNARYSRAALDQWIASLPPSSNLPPAGSGYGRKGKPDAASS